MLFDSGSIDFEAVHIEFHPKAFSDSDLSRDVDTRRSVTGYIFFLANGPIIWCSKLQECVALSSMEAEYISACAAAQEALWLLRLLRELRCLFQLPFQLMQDNQSCIYLSASPHDHPKSKHIDRKYHFVRDLVLEGTLILKKIATAENTADIFTKPLDRQPFQYHRGNMLVQLTTTHH